MQAITYVICENSSIVYVVGILRLCDGQGRLIIKKTLTLISYFSVAMSV